jgi:Flp pilus assembly protein CpaB
MRTPLFIAGVALALVAFLVMFAIGIVFVGRSQPTGSVPVVVASKTIDARTPITADELTLAYLPVSAVPPNTYLHISELTATGYSAAVPIYKGQAVSANLIVPSDQIANIKQSYLPIPQGYVAVTLQANELQAVAGWLTEGDYIDVMADIPKSALFDKATGNVTVTAFTSLHVIRVGIQSSLPSTAEAPVQRPVQGVVSSITVVMTECDANYMDWLINHASLKYNLLSYHDYNPQTPAPDPSCTTAKMQQPVYPGDVAKRWDIRL